MSPQDGENLGPGGGGRHQGHAYLEDRGKRTNGIYERGLIEDCGQPRTVLDGSSVLN